jgi:hypothetical protein
MLNNDVFLCSQKIKLEYTVRESLLLTRTNGPSRVHHARGNEVERKIVCRGRMSLGTASCRRNEPRGFCRWI